MASQSEGRPAPVKNLPPEMLVLAEMRCPILRRNCAGGVPGFAVGRLQNIEKIQSREGISAVRRLPRHGRNGFNGVLEKHAIQRNSDEYLAQMADLG